MCSMVERVSTRGFASKRCGSGCSRNGTLCILRCRVQVGIGTSLKETYIAAESHAHAMQLLIVCMRVQ
jgi:hypothetical protein